MWQLCFFKIRHIFLSQSFGSSLKLTRSRLKLRKSFRDKLQVCVVFLRRIFSGPDPKPCFITPQLNWLGHPSFAVIALDIHIESEIFLCERIEHFLGHSWSQCNIQRHFAHSNRTFPNRIYKYNWFFRDYFNINER